MVLKSRPVVTMAGVSQICFWSTTPPRRGWQSIHWSGVTKNYARAVEGISSHMLTWGVLVGVITCVGVGVCLVIRPHAYLHLFFLYFWQLNARFLVKKEALAHASRWLEPNLTGAAGPLAIHRGAPAPEPYEQLLHALLLASTQMPRGNI